MNYNVFTDRNRNNSKIFSQTYRLKSNFMFTKKKKLEKKIVRIIIIVVA